jgi:preprotein translocase subunit SecG
LEFLIPSVKIIHIIVAILLVLIILLQPSKSADIGSMFGGGSSESLFGSSGAMPFLVKMTRLLGLIFVITSLFLGYTSVKSVSGSVVEKSPIEVFEETSLPVEEPSGEPLQPSKDGE